MKNKLVQTIPLLTILLGLASAPVSYWCIYSNGYCYATWVHHIYPYFTNPFYSFSLFLLPIAVVFVFITRNIFNSWLKFAIWAIPLVIIFIALTPVSFTGLGMDFFPFYRDDAARLAGEVFSSISLILIIYRALRSAPTK
jgi:hypothetical protein